MEKGRDFSDNKKIQACSVVNVAEEYFLSAMVKVAIKSMWGKCI